jgi:hypothetical protein
MNATHSKTEERTKCASDFVYFCENYLKISHPSKGLIPFKLGDEQKRLCKFYDDHQYVAAKKQRRVGLTTTTAAWLYWKAAFTPNTHVCVCAKTEREAFTIQQTIRRFVIQSMDELGIHFDDTSGSVIELNANSSIRCGTAEKFRGTSATHVFVDEAAYIPNMESCWKTMLTPLSDQAGCKYLVVSTPNWGDTWFRKLFEGAVEGTNEFKAFEADLLKHPEFNYDSMERLCKAMGMRSFQQELLGWFDFVPDLTFGATMNRIGIRGPQKPQNGIYDVEEKEPILLFAHDKATPDVDLAPFLKAKKSNCGPLVDRKESLVTSEEVAECDKIYDEMFGPKKLPEKKRVGGNLFEGTTISMDAKQYEDLELLKLAGVVAMDSQPEDVPLDDDDYYRRLLFKIAEGLPRKITLSIDEKCLNVNGVPTRISSKAVADTFHGLKEFVGVDKAIDSTSRLVRKRLFKLFPNVNG